MIESTRTWLGSDALTAALRDGDLDLEGRLAGASNATLRCLVEVAEDIHVRCVYKPVRGERPLWDFPNGTLSGREVAAFELSQVLGWSVVPPTVWRADGPAGPGMCQAWIDHVPGEDLVAVVPREAPIDGWMTVLEGHDGEGREVLLMHAASAALQQVALLDAVINNADRKGGHLLVDADGHLWGIDHGVTFADEDKLRTVLWGWAGEAIPDHLLAPLEDVVAAAGHDFGGVAQWLSGEELRALRQRINELVQGRTFPEPSLDWPSIPWPVF